MLMSVVSSFEIQNMSTKMKNNESDLSAREITKAEEVDLSCFVSVEYIENRLLELNPDVAWDLFVKMNELLLGNEAWMKHALSISEKLRQKMKMQELNQERFLKLMEKTADTPATQNIIYPQSGSTANIGCNMVQPEFKMIEKKGEDEL